MTKRLMTKRFAPVPHGPHTSSSQHSEVPNNTLCSSISKDHCFSRVGGMEKCALIDAPRNSTPSEKVQRGERAAGKRPLHPCGLHVSFSWLVPNVRAQCSKVIHGFHVQWHRASMGRCLACHKGLDRSTEEKKDFSFDNSTNTGVSLDYMPNFDQQDCLLWRNRWWTYSAPSGMKTNKTAIAQDPFLFALGNHTCSRKSATGNIPIRTSRP